MNTIFVSPLQIRYGLLALLANVVFDEGSDKKQYLLRCGFLA